MTMPVAKECADRYIQEHLGEEYAVDVKREESIIAAVLVGVLIKFYNKIYDKVTKKGKHE